MSSLMERGRALAARRSYAAGESVTYSRSGVETVSVTAVPGRTMVERSMRTDVVVSTASRDWIIPSASILDFGEPERGDIISDANGVRYEVMQVGNAVWQWHDHGRTVYRIHAKRA